MNFSGSEASSSSFAYLSVRGPRARDRGGLSCRARAGSDLVAEDEVGAQGEGESGRWRCRAGTGGVPVRPGRVGQPRYKGVPLSLGHQQSVIEPTLPDPGWAQSRGGYQTP
jgi:hypothetical protein